MITYTVWFIYILQKLRDKPQFNIQTEELLLYFSVMMPLSHVFNPLTAARKLLQLCFLG